MAHISPLLIANGENVKVVQELCAMPAVGLRWKSIPRLVRLPKERPSDVWSRLFFPNEPRNTHRQFKVVRSDHRWEFGKRVEGIR